MRNLASLLSIFWLGRAKFGNVLLVIFVIAASLGQQAHAVEESIEYTLVQIPGYIIKGQTIYGVTSTVYDEYHAKYLDVDLLAGIENLPIEEATQRALFFIANRAYDLGMREELRFSHGGGSIQISGRASHLTKLIRSLFKEGYRFEFSGRSGRSEVGSDIRELLQKKQNAVEDIVREFKSALFGLGVVTPDGQTTFSVKPEDAYSQLLGLKISHWLERIDKIEIPGRNKDWPDRVLVGEEKNFNYHRLSHAELQWYNQIQSLKSNLKKLAEQFQAIQSGLLTNKVKELMGSQQLESALFKKIAAKDPSVTELADMDRQTRKAFITAAASLLDQFRFEVRNPNVQWEEIDPALLLPIYSYGLLVAIEAIENHGFFDPKDYSSLAFEQSFLDVIRHYVEESFPMDQYSRAVLIRVAKNPSLHSLIRLCAFVALERHTNFNEAVKLTGISREEWARLYPESGERIVLSPTPFSLRRIPHIDYMSNFKMPVDSLIKALEVTRLRLGLNPIRYQSRNTMEAVGLQATAEGTKGAALVNYAYRGIVPQASEFSDKRLEHREANLTPPPVVANVLPFAKKCRIEMEGE